MFSCNSGKRLLLACNSQHFAGVVNFDFAKATEHRLTEEERGTLVAHHRSTHVFEFKTAKVYVAQIDDGSFVDVAVGILKVLAAHHVAFAQVAVLHHKGGFNH